MKDVFVEREWNELCQRVMATATNLAPNSTVAGRYEQQAKAFCEQSTPQRYPELLSRVREAAELAKQWQSQRESAPDVDDLIDEAGEESFPASDPPVFSRAHA